MTVGQLLATLTERFARAGIDSARLDARLLVAEALGVEPLALVTRPERPLSAEEEARIAAMAARREAREPMSHILGRRGFWTLTLKVTRDTLDPRADTETVVQAVLDLLPDRERPYRFLDFGTGTGAILLALLSEYPHATGLGIDKSPEALAVAEENARANGLTPRVEFRLGEWGRDLAECFDAITSNPPYIPDQDIAALDPEVARHEPWMALAGGPDGLDCYRALAPDIARLLAPGGIAALEVGAGQAQAVEGFLQAAGLTPGPARRDLSGIERCVVASAPAMDAAHL